AIDRLSSHSGFGRVQFDPLSRPIVRVGTARGLTNGIEVCRVQWQRLGDVLEVSDDLLRLFSVHTFERFVWCALNSDDARFAFQVSRLQVFTWKYFFSCHGINLSGSVAAYRGIAKSVAAGRTQQARLRANNCSRRRVAAVSRERSAPLAA